MHDIGTPRCSVRCAHVGLSARLFPCAWRTLLKAGTVEQVYESSGVRFSAGLQKRRGDLTLRSSTAASLAGLALFENVLCSACVACCISEKTKRVCNILKTHLFIFV